MSPNEATGTGGARWQWKLLLAITLVGIAALAWVMTGPRPRAVPGTRAATSRSIPPFVVRDDEGAGSPAARAARLLQQGKRTKAAEAFGSIASSSDGAARVRAQLGVELARWETGKPAASLARMRRIASTEAGNPAVLLQLGVAELVGGDVDTGRATLRRALVEASTARPAAWDVARHADDLLHPDISPGYPPIVVAPGDASTLEGRRLVEQLVAAVTAGDRVTARRRAGAAAARALAERDPVVLSAVAAAAFEKVHPLRSVSVVREARRPVASATPAQLQLAVILLWTGSRSDADALLEVVARRQPHSASERRWSELATELRKRV